MGPPYSPFPLFLCLSPGFISPNSAYKQHAWKSSLKPQHAISVMCLSLTKSLQLYPLLCNPVDCSPPGSSVHGDSPGKNTGVGCHAVLQGIFPTQGSNPGLLHCRWILFCLSHQGSPGILEGSLSLLQGIFPAQESNQGSLHGRQILYQLSY